MGTGEPSHWELEWIKRRLDQFAQLVAPAQGAVLLDSPAAADVEGQMRVEGLESLLAAKRIALHSGTARDASQARLAAIWLGDSPEELESLRRHPPDRVLLWPRPEQATETRALLAGWTGPPPIICSPGVGDEAGAAAGDTGTDGVRALPDPAHALWGLLDHHPRGKGVLELPDGGWDGMLPPSRVAILRHIETANRGLLPAGSLGLRLRRIARRRVLEAARRLVVAHAAVSGTRVGGSVLAALLGRGFRVAPAATPENATRIAAYWAGWRAEVAAR